MPRGASPRLATGRAYLRWPPEPRHHLGRYAAAVLDLNALRPGPLPNLGGVQAAGTGAPPAPALLSPGTRAPAGGIDERRQRLRSASACSALKSIS